MEVLYYLALLAISILVSKYLFHQRKSPLPLPIIGHLYLLKPPVHRTLANLANQYGPVLFLRYGFRRVLLVSSPSAIEECLTKNDIVFANRPNFVVGKYVGYNYTSLVWAPYGDHWRNLRRISAQEIFSSSRFQLFSTHRSEEIRSLIQQLTRDSNGTNFHKVEFNAIFYEFVLNNLMRMIGGKQYYGDNVRTMGEAIEFRNIVTEMFRLVKAPNLGDFFPCIRWLDVQRLEKKMENSHKEIDDFMQHLIDEHKEKELDDSSLIPTRGGEKRKTMIDVLLSLQHNDPGYYTDGIIKGLIAAILTAGTDATSTTLEWAMSLLLNHPEVLKQAKAEIDTHVGQERQLEESDLPNLPYLHNIINETLRLYPPAPTVVHEASKDCTVGGFHVPSGTMLLMHVWAVHRDPKVWADPLEFKPERFEDRHHEGFNFIPFGSGRRRCPGEALATRMIGLALGTLVQCFEWERLGEELIDMSEGDGLSLPRATPLVVMCRPRSIMMTILPQEKDYSF